MLFAAAYSLLEAASFCLLGLRSSEFAASRSRAVFISLLRAFELEEPPS